LIGKHGHEQHLCNWASEVFVEANLIDYISIRPKEEASMQAKVHEEILALLLAELVAVMKRIYHEGRSYGGPMRVSEDAKLLTLKSSA
jgi:hypothetical protein